MTKARDEKRIGLPLPYDPSRPVNTFWDIGMDDENCIWFHQTDGGRHRLIDFYQNSGEGLPALHSGDRKALGFAVPLDGNLASAMLAIMESCAAKGE